MFAMGGKPEKIGQAEEMVLSAQILHVQYMWNNVCALENVSEFVANQFCFSRQ
jgi:hypothetical protein